MLADSHDGCCRNETANRSMRPLKVVCIPVIPLKKTIDMFTVIIT
jgi:hypothetical protein